MLVILGMPACTNAVSSGHQNSIQIVHRAEKKRVDVFIDNAHFTSYLFSEAGSSLKKPILYPLRTATGVNIARGWPFDQKAGERVDHPHHTGYWFNYGDVNGFDFWNHSTSTPEERLAHMGTIVHRSVENTTNGENTGSFSVVADWMRPDGSAILEEHTTFNFFSGPDRRIIDRTTTLKAVDGPVDFTDNKEGMIAIRVTRALEHVDDNPVLLSDANGEPRAAKEVNNEGVSGEYESESGVRGTAVWGTRAPWMMLSGEVENEAVTVAIIDHPDNPGYPTYWHARGYGLFAANPLGQRVFSEGKEALDFRLEHEASVTFKYRMAILTNPADPRAEVTALFSSFHSSENN